MKHLTKTAIIYLMVSLIQIGLGASVMEASSLHKNSVSMMQQYDQEQDRHEAERIENERHEQALERRPNESEREWNERQNRENERHERSLTRIAHAILM